MASEQFDTAFRPATYAELRQMSPDHIVAIFDSLSPRSRPGGVEFNDPNFWLAELYRRDQEQINRSMLAFTKWVTVMTVVITAATLVMLWAALKTTQIL
jgi:hypothetical protein